NCAFASSPSRPDAARPEVALPPRKHRTGLAARQLGTVLHIKLYTGLSGWQGWRGVSEAPGLRCSQGGKAAAVRGRVIGPLARAHEFGSRPGCDANPGSSGHRPEPHTTSPPPLPTRQTVL